MQHTGCCCYWYFLILRLGCNTCSVEYNREEKKKKTYHDMSTYNIRGRQYVYHTEVLIWFACVYTRNNTSTQCSLQGAPSSTSSGTFVSVIRKYESVSGFFVRFTRVYALINTSGYAVSRSKTHSDSELQKRDVHFND